MFGNIKELIKELSYSAVNMAEKTLSSEDGQKKKAAAIQYIVERLPIAAPFKTFVVLILTKFIDEAIEQAVQYMKSVRNED